MAITIDGESYVVAKPKFSVVNINVEGVGRKTFKRQKNEKDGAMATRVKEEVNTLKAEVRSGRAAQSRSIVLH